MKVKFDKLREFKIFGIKVFELRTQYMERSIDKDDDEDDFYISLSDRIIKTDK